LEQANPKSVFLFTVTTDIDQKITRYPRYNIEIESTFKIYFVFVENRLDTLVFASKCHLAFQTQRRLFVHPKEKKQLFHFVACLIDQNYL
jgi:hypothetical protein